MVSSKNEVFEYLIDQLRQQVINNPYKQQCEDLAHEVQSLKNQLRDASAQIKELHMALVKATGDAEAYKLIREQEQSGCRKDDAQECAHNRYVFYKGAMYKKCGVRKECDHDWVLDEKGDYFVCAKCGKQEAELNDCQHTNTVGLRKGFAPGFTKKCLDCGVKLK
ncbi:TPA: hypothetical protein OT587_004636 [Escherichia coli]|nr:hypothetical protein [Escherichia coli]